MTDVDAIARELDEKIHNEIVSVSTHSRKLMRSMFRTALRERDEEWQGKLDSLLAEVERLRGELSKTTGDHIFEMD